MTEALDRFVGTCRKHDVPELYVGLQLTASGNAIMMGSTEEEAMHQMLAMLGNVLGEARAIMSREPGRA